MQLKLVRDKLILQLYEMYTPQLDTWRKYAEEQSASIHGKWGHDLPLPERGSDTR